MLTFKKSDFKKSHRGYVAVVLSESPMDIPGLHFFHENSTVRQGKVEILLGKKVTQVYCNESICEGRYRYAFRI